MSEKIETTETGDFSDGIKFNTSRALLNRTLNKIKFFGNVLSVAVPTVFLFYYALSLALSDNLDYGFFAKCVLMALVAIQLMLNVIKIARKSQVTSKKTIKKFKRLKRYIKILISAGICGFAIYDVFTLDNFLIKFIGAAVLLIALIVRVLIEAVIFISEHFFNKLFTAVVMDVEKISNSGIGKAVSFISNPKRGVTKGLDNFVMKLSGKESEQKEIEIPDFIADKTDFNQETREELRELEKEFAKSRQIEKEEKKAEKKIKKKQASKEAKDKLVEHIKDFIHK